MRRGASAALVALLAACSSPAKAPAPAAPPSAAGPTAAEDEADPEAQIAAIASAVNHYAPDVHGCWKIAAADDVRLGGSLVLRLEIGELRSARSVEVVHDEPRDPVLQDCMVKLWERVVWPKGVFAAGDVIQLPPFEFVAPESQHTIDAAHVAPQVVAGASLGGGSLGGGEVAVQAVLGPRNTGNDAAALSVWTVASGATVPLHRHPDRTVLLYVIAGRGRLLDQRVVAPRADRRQAVDFQGHELAAGAAAYVAPGVAHGVGNASEDDLVLLRVEVPAAGEGEAIVAVPPGELGSRRARAEPRPQVVAAGTTDALPIAGGSAQVRLLLDSASRGEGASYLGLLEAEPGSVIPPHVHERSTEILYVLAGEGTLEVDGAELPLRPGVAAQVPPGIEHGGVLAGSDTFRAVQIYTPGGPEQRFKGQK